MRNPKAKIPVISETVSPSGSRTKPVFESRFNGKKIVLDQTGLLDTQKEIEAFAPFTDLNYMLHRLSVGDRSVLARSSPIFGDFSSMPNNPIDAINMVRNAEASFAHMSLEDRQSFGNDYRVWLASLFSGNPGKSDSVSADQPGAGDPVKEDMI